MKNQSFFVFQQKLNEWYLSSSSYHELALHLQVNESTLKGWLSGSRHPTIKRLDQIADQLGCFTHELICPHSPILFHKNPRKNHSHHAFSQNLGIIFNQKGCYRTVQKLTLLEGLVTDFALQSYLREQNYRLPTLKKLDQIADVLQMEAYLLLQERS